MPDVRLSPPEPPPAASNGERYKPPPPPPPAAVPPVEDGSRKPGAPPPPAAPEDRSPPQLPVDIPQYALAKERVASALKPFPDGLDWLKTQGYRTVLYLRGPGEDDSADRKQVEKRGLKYISLEVAPESLTRTTVDEFNAIVGEAGNLPLFVYDRDGMLAGGMWYLHFRRIDGLTDAEARKKAAALGLKEDENGPHRVMWLAIQKVLSETPDR
jgi:protein tyrosine phosphatase (PTP) superfamily phosphohydrolase (DUF442 family)